MTDYKYQFTKEEIDEVVESMRLIMDFVRVLTADEIKGQHELNTEDRYCYKALNKTKPCDFGISEKALREKKDATKLEFINGECYQFFARYVIVDGQECTIEAAKKISERAFIDSDGYKELVTKVTDTNTRMYKDALTGVYNRAYYEEVEKYNTTPAGIAMLDLDDFKQWNDTYKDHAAGDLALQTAVKVILNNIRSNDKVIRYGGDEFVLILEGIQEDSFGRKLDRIRQQIHSAVVPGFSTMSLSASIGAMISTTESRDDCVMAADRLMYMAKQYKNRVVTKWENIDEFIRVERESLENKPLLLIVDDSEMNRFLLRNILEEDYRVIEAKDGEEAVRMIDQYHADISMILLDIVMPKLDGFGVLEFMNVNDIVEDIPVIMISSMNEDSAIKRCYELGISEYIKRPFDSEIVKKRVGNIINLYKRQRKLQHEIQAQVEERERNSRIVTSIISHVVETRNGESGPHVIHVEKITEILLDKLTEISDKYPLTKQDKQQISLASALHDIGKIGIDEKIINKPGKLTDEEYEIMKTHTVLGADMINQVLMEEDDPLIHYAYEICRWHHEKWDGRGYPDGLKGNEIPISAQVVSVADVYDALVSERVYKKAFSHEKAIEMILNGECGEFNPLLKQCLIETEDRIQLAEAKIIHEKSGGGLRIPNPKDE